MKTAMIARFVLGAGAIFAAAGLAGCGAETGQGPGESIGASEQAINLSLTSPSSTYAVKFPSAVNIDANTVLVVGGITSTGAGSEQAWTYNKNTDTWTQKTSIPTGKGRGLAQFVLIPGTGDKYLLAGGVASGAALNTSVIYDVSADEWTTVTDTLDSARFGFPLLACGTGSKLLAVGGIDTVASPRSNSALKKLDVFSFDSSGNGKGAGSTWAPLQTSAPADLEMNKQRGFAGAVVVDSTHIHVFGGLNALTVESSQERLTFSTSCDAASKSAANAYAAMPSARAKFALADLGGTYLMAGGTDDDAHSVPVSTYIFDPSVPDATHSGFTSAGSISAGRWYPTTSATSTSGVFSFVGGVVPQVAAPQAEFYTSSAVQDLYTVGTGWSTGTSLATARYGAWQALLNGSVIVGHGATIASGGATTFPQNPE